jgi:hypothetical protein
MSVERTELKNGLTVISHTMPEVETVSLGIWVGAGSRSEGPGEHGVAHFQRRHQRGLDRLLCAGDAQGHAARPRYLKRHPA